MEVLRNVNSVPNEIPASISSNELLRHFEEQVSELNELRLFKLKDTSKLSTRAESAIQSRISMSRQGYTFHACERFEEAAIIYKLIAKSIPSMNWYKKLAETRLQLAVISMHSNRYVLAENSFNEAINNYSLLIKSFKSTEDIKRWGDACVGLSLFLKLEGRIDESLQLFEITKEKMKKLDSNIYPEWLKSSKDLLNKM